MSASKKKQQRRDAVDTEKFSQAQVEQTAYKKKARLYTVIGIVVVVLVAALLVWNSGIFQKNATAATVGDTKLSAAELSYYYYDTRYMYAMYNLIDSNASDAEQMYSETKSYQDFFLESALTSAQNVQATYQAAIKAGYSDNDVKDDVTTQMESMKLSAASNGYAFKSFLKAVYGPYMTPSIFESMITRELLANKYYSDRYNEAYDSFSAADLDAYYAENADEVDTYTYSYLYFRAETVATTGEDGKKLSDEEVAALKEAAMADALTKAEDATAAYRDGANIADLIADTTPSSSADHTSVIGQSAISTVFKDELLALGRDEAAVVEYENNGYYLVIFHERFLNEKPTVNVRHVLVRASASTADNGSTAAPLGKDWTAALSEAESILAEFEAGAQTADAFAALANKYSDDTGSNTNGGLYEGIREGDFVTEFNDWMFGSEERAVGDTAIIRHEGNAETESNPYWGYHVTYIDGFGEAHWQVNVRETLTETSMTELEESMVKDCPAELASGAYVLGK